MFAPCYCLAFVTSTIKQSQLSATPKNNKTKITPVCLA